MAKKKKSLDDARGKKTKKEESSTKDSDELKVASAESFSEPKEDDIELEMEEDIVEESGVNDKLKKLREELKEAKQVAKDNMDGWQRSRADYTNLQKSLETEKSGIRKRAVEDLINDLLSTLDNFDMAMKNKEVWEKVDKQWRTGIEYIYSQLQNSLFDRGVEEINDTSAEFDPELHEPLETVETEEEKEDGKIIEILQKGYKLDGRVLRPAKVKVYKVSP